MVTHIDTGRERTVLRIVYDGPALAGKTTTLRALASQLQQPVFSSEGADGRTLHFDWMEHVGGSLDGRSLCCQVVTVPGQPALASRRLALLSAADTVIFVVGSRPDEIDSGLAALASLMRFLAQQPGPRPGVLLQANKRDRPDALALSAIRARLALADTVAVTETSATDGSGVLAGFVLAVRVAVDHWREAERQGLPAAGAPFANGAPELLAALDQLANQAAPGTRPGPALPRTDQMQVVPTSSPATRASGSPPPPTADLPTGRVWPPVEGRLILHEATAGGVTLEQNSAGDWRGHAGPWQLHAAAAGSYADTAEGAAALLSWARWHASLGTHLSRRRAIALVESPDGACRLWQVVHREATLGAWIRETLADPDPDTIARMLLAAASALRTIHRSVAPTGLRSGVETVGLLEAGPAYIALAPSPRGLGQRPAGFAPRQLDLARELGPLLASRQALPSPVRAMIRARLEELAQVAGEVPTGDRLADLLAERDTGGDRPNATSETARTRSQAAP